MGNNKSTHAESFLAIPWGENGAKAFFGEIIYGSGSKLREPFFSPSFGLRDFLVWNVFSLWKCGRVSLEILIISYCLHQFECVILVTSVFTLLFVSLILSHIFANSTAFQRYFS